MKYNKLSPDVERKILNDRENGVKNPYRCDDSAVIRRNENADRASLWRPAFVRDIEKIIHLPYYNRYADKTQVFSFYNNDDITRRALHVQLVSRIARNIGAVLGLNLDLIEAISLGHDIGHTPFGHAGERFLSRLLFKETGKLFNHNVHSVRVLDNLFERNISLQTLDGILCHNGEFEQQEYRPAYGKTFDEFDKSVQECYASSDAIHKLVPSTLEGCVVRICDMIAYLGKDRQDARIAKIIPPNYKFQSEVIGGENASIINNLTVDIIENSYGKDYILLSPGAYNDLKRAKEENYSVIYKNEQINRQYNEIIGPMFAELYYKLLDEVKSGSEGSIIYRHHIKFIMEAQKYYTGGKDYLADDPNMIVADFIASMTDDYFIALHEKLFPGSRYKIKYKSYFSEDNI
ncbi:MAG: HD domain-containing protein [Anaerotruncus sp.]|nr:HD domain-containing protein [Anaerotruncus sp.]